MAKRRPKDPEKMSFMERFMFSFMGPPELGDINAPVAERPKGPAELCSKCRTPIDDHEVVRDPGLTYMRCPSA